MRFAENILTHWPLVILVVVLALQETSWGRTIYVDANAKGRNNGSSWVDANPNLDSALWSARAATKPVEVRVAQGIYKPSYSGSVGGPPDVVAEERRKGSFKLYSGVTLKGGYAGLGAEDPNARDIIAFRTILSGDHNGDDVELSRSILPDSRTPLFDLRHRANRKDNSRCVVTGFDVDETAVLDGFIITGGYHDIAGREDPTGGGGLNTNNGSPTVIDCTFVGNCVVQSGGSVKNSYSTSPTFIRCTFQANYAGDGGGMYNYQSHPVLIDCLFVANYATERGGGIANVKTSNPKLTRCRFVGNSARQDGGGGVFNVSSSPVMNNCLFVGNSARAGAGISDTWNSRARLNGCILWDNHGPAFATTASSADVQWSDIEGGWPGSGNIDADPCFANPGHWVNPSDPNVPGDPTDVNAIWVDGDYHLKSQSGRWDPSSQSWVKDDVTSPCIDAGDPNSPVGDEPFPNGGRINMGAYGGTAEASKSYFGEPACETIIAGDINGDCKVDSRDLAILSQHWLAFGDVLVR
ncbi:MAG: hypothetical protein A2Y76_15310 [Planctomycetes bacterium RBG_13_60_9]|nr:MAG: hypothetical protein A2Y76_15310 [Planctomycetes bacterium RBG_13_60_9]